MKYYTVQCSFCEYIEKTVKVEANNIEQACELAVNKANEEETLGWERQDYISGTFVSAIAEGEDVDPWQLYTLNSSLPVPDEYTEAALHRSPGCYVLDERERAIAFAALRFFLFEEAPEEGGTVDTMKLGEIVALCDRLNVS